MKQFLAAAFYIFGGILVFLTALVGFAARWAFASWGALDMDEIIFHLTHPLEGAAGEIVQDYLLQGLLPAVIILAVYIILLLKLKRGRPRILCTCTFLFLVVGSGILIKDLIWSRLDMDHWIRGQIEESEFVEANYADPAEVSLTFPEKKRNLIYLFLESMEVTYTDKASGGDFAKNVIPELTSIARDYEDFSGNEKKLEGGLVLPGCGFTTGAIFAQTAGLPLKTSTSGNFMDTQSSFFQGVTALGDILENEGYRQVFLCGSDAVFGGRKLYFETHGNFEIQDYYYAREQGLIDPDYWVWWGYEDEKLFSFAEDTLSELAAGEEPFSLVMLTVDTHYEDGYVCNLCRNEFRDNQYANVMACSSRQVSDFLSWIRKQDFYENTTVVICGDHTTMDTDFCDRVSEDYQRKVYTAVVNSAVEPEQPERERIYSTLDLYPTTLASLGVRIEGERLALGTNLFSSRDTLLEEYGQEEVKEELSHKSAFLQSLEQMDEESSGALLERYREVMEGSLSVDHINPSKQEIRFRFTNKYLYDKLVDDSLRIEVEKIELEYQEKGHSKSETIELVRDPETDGSYTGTADLSDWLSLEGSFRVNLYTADGKEYKNVDSIDYISQ